MRFCKLALSGAVVMSCFSGLLAPVVKAQNSDPVATVSVAPLDRVMTDTSYMLKACGVPEMAGLASLMVNQYTQGIDRSRPMSVQVTLQGQMPMAVIALPMSDRDAFFGALAGMGIEPDDLGDGLFEIDAGGQTIFAKHSGDWMHVAQMESAVAGASGDPSAALGDLPTRYDIAIRLNIQALPADLKEMIIEQMRMGFESGLAQQGGQTEEEREAARQMGEASIEQIKQLIDDTQRVIIGWAVDPSTQKTYIDSGAQFVEGSKLAQQANDAANQTSDFTGFMLPDSAAKFRFSSTIADGDKELAKNNFRNSIGQAKRQIENSGDMPEEAKTLVMNFIEGFSTLMEQTIDEGTFDGAGSLSVADDTLRMLVGGRIADGNALADQVKELVGGLPKGPEVPSFEFDYATHGGVTLHRATVPLKIADPAAKRIFGDSLNVTIGTADKAFLIAVDPAGDVSAKAAIDSMNSAKGVKVSPFEGVVQVEQILRFAQAVSPNSMLDNVIDTVSQYKGNDKVEINGRVIARGVVYRMSIDEGVLRGIGTAAKAGRGGGGGF